MTWALDTSTQGTLGAADPLTLNHTCSAATTLLVAVVFLRDTAARTGGALTYNGVTMTDSGQGQVVPVENASVEVWYLINPPTGSSYALNAPNTALLSGTISAMSFESTGDAALDNSNSATGTSTAPTVSVTMGNANGLMVGGLGSGDRDVPSAGGAYTLVHTDDAGNQVWASEYDLDSGASGGVTVDFTTPHSEDYAIIGVGFYEAAAAARRIFITHG